MRIDFAIKDPMDVNCQEVCIFTCIEMVVLFWICRPFRLV